jgi:hypothetical protein
MSLDRFSKILGQAHSYPLPTLFEQFAKLVISPSDGSEFDIRLLTLLSAGDEQNDDAITIFAEIDSKTWPEVDSVLKNPAADSLHIGTIPQTHSDERS